MIIGILPFEAITRDNLVAYRASRPDLNNIYFVRINTGHLRRIYKQILLNIKFYINKAVFYYNKSHLEGP